MITPRDTRPLPPGRDAAFVRMVANHTHGRFVAVSILVGFWICEIQKVRTDARKRLTYVFPRPPLLTGHANVQKFFGTHNRAAKFVPRRRAGRPRGGSGDAGAAGRDSPLLTRLKNARKRHLIPNRLEVAKTTWHVGRTTWLVVETIPMIVFPTCHVILGICVSGSTWSVTGGRNRNFQGGKQGIAAAIRRRERFTPDCGMISEIKRYICLS